MHPRQLIGLDVGGTKCALGLEADGQGFAEVARFATAGPAETLARFAEAIGRLPPAAERRFGVSCGGPLDAARGVVLSPPNLPGWDNVGICSWLVTRFGGEARLMNDANAGALAEWREGAGRGARTMVFLTMGTGMGAGLIVDGRLHEGASGNAGEVGHLRLAPEGPVGFGKAGSFEGFCSGGGIAQLMQKRVAAFAGASRLKDLPPAQLNARELGGAAEAGDALALALWAEVGERLGQGLALLIDVLNPDRIVIGGIYVRCERFIAPAMHAAIGREALPDSARDCRVVPAALGEEIGSRAAVAIARMLAEENPPGIRENENDYHSENDTSPQLPAVPPLMKTSRREFLQNTSLLAAALPLANVNLAAASAAPASTASRPDPKRPLLFDAADLPRIRANTQLPRFKDLWATLVGADLAADRKYLENEVKFNDHAFSMIRVRTVLERSAFVYAVTGRADHLAIAKLALRKMLDYPKWDYFLEGGKIVMGLQRAPEATIAAAFALDWLQGQLTPAEVAEVEKAIAEKGAPACYTTLHGMRYPDRVRGWGFDPEDNYPYKIIDFKRWPLILNATNLKVIPTAALGIAGTLLHGRHPEADKWLEMSRSSARAFSTMFGTDGAYDEGVSYWGYTVLHLAMVAEVMYRRLGIDDRQLINYPGTVRYAMTMSMPTIGKPGDCVNFGDASKFGDNAVAGWVSTRFKDPVSQHIAANAGEPLYQYGLVWYDEKAPSAPPPPDLLDSRNALDLVVSRTGWDERAGVVALRSGGPANHEHADRNSVIFAAYGERLLHDPFKAAYPYTEPHWVLRLTKAHTAVLVNGEGHQYHNGHEGTNPSWAMAKVVAYRTGPNWMAVTSDATEAYELVTADVARVERTVVYLKPDVLLLLDRVKLKTTALPVQARFQVYGDDLKAKLTADGASFRIERPAASLQGQSYGSGPVAVKKGKFDLKPEQGNHEYAEAESAAATEHTLLTVMTAQPTGGAHGTLAVARSGAEWRVTGTHQRQRVNVTLRTDGALPVVTIA